MRTRPLILSIALALATILAGLTIRFATLGLPQSVTKYGGSTLWALMIYWLISTLLPAWSIPSGALASGLLATTVEFLKLLNTPTLDAFRLTLPGILLLGRFFSPWDIVAYWLAILVGALADRLIRSHIGNRPAPAPPPLTRSSPP